MSDEQILTESREYLNSPIIESHKTSEEISERIIFIVKNCLEDSKALFDMCQRIKDTVESHFIGSWGCIARYSNNGSYSHLTFSSLTVDINFGKLLISVYKSYDKVFMN